MRTLDRNKQKMLYSLQTGRNTPIYEKDEQGNTKYITVDGREVPVESGEYEPEYTEPTEFMFPNMGYRDGYILVDGARQKDILNLDELGCFGCVLPDGSAIARESWTGNGFVEDDKFEEKYKKAVADNMDGFLTVLDIHD